MAARIGRLPGIRGRRILRFPPERAKAPGAALSSSPAIETGVDRAMAWCQPARPPSWQASSMEHVLGIGGYFIRAADPAALNAWYRDCLGLNADEHGLWRQGAGPTVFATFESETG